jgi:subtilase family serine protease
MICRVNRIPIRVRSRRSALVAGLVLATVAGSALVASAAPDATSRAVVAGDQPTWASASNDRGQVDTGTQVDARVYLAGADPAGLDAFAAAVSDPRNPRFKHYLTSAQFAARFGPTTTQLDAVTSWLRGTGLTVTGVNQHYVSVHGSVADAQSAFGVAIHDFANRAGTHHAPTGQVNVPASVSSAVLGVTGLDDAPAMAHPQDDVPPTAPVTLRATPCSTYSGQSLATTEPPAFGQTQPWTNCGYTPQQIRSGYGVDKVNFDGHGSTIAIVDAYASPTLAADETTYNNHYGRPDFVPGQLVQDIPAGGWNSVDACGGNVWYPEEAMDVEAAHDIAPGAKVDMVYAASCNDPDLLDALSRITDNHLADIVSSSWGLELDGSVTPALRDSYQQVFKQGAAEGIGFYFSSGDCGYYDPKTRCGSADGSVAKQVEFPVDDPWATGVGGTTLALNATGHQLWQTGWGDDASALSADGTSWNAPSYYDGGGGGVSTNYPQPAYQAGIVPNSLATALPDGTTATTPMRVSPDVSMDGDNSTGLLVGYTQKFADGNVAYHEERWAGTSLSCPLFAGMQALAQQAGGYGPIGFANPQLYTRYATSAYTDVTDHPLGPDTRLGVVRDDYTNVHDGSTPITTALRAFGDDGNLKATAGFDDVTGVGTPSADYVGSYNGNHPGPPPGQ